MKKYLKLVICCLLLCICCFCVAGCSNNSKSINVSEQETYNNSNDEHIQRINKEVNNFLTKEGFEGANYNHKNKIITISTVYENKKEEIKDKIENYINVKDMEVIIND